MHNINIERAILATILYAPEKCEGILESLEDEAFYHPTYRDIYQTIQYLSLKNIPLHDEFIRKHYKGAALDEDVFFDILSTTPISNTAPYIKELIELWNNRKIEKSANEILSKVQSGKDVTDLIIGIGKLSAPIRKIQPFHADKLEAQEPEFVCKSWLPIPRGALTVISAAGGTGKSWLALQLAMRYVFEEKKKVFLWLSEDRASICKDRLLKISAFTGLDITGLIHIETSFPPLLLRKSKAGTEIDPYFYQIRKTLLTYDFVLFDPLLAFYGGNENDNSEARIFMQPFMNWAAEENKSIVFLHHSRKNNQDGENKVRGAGAFIDSARCAYEIERIYQKKELDARRLHEREIKLTKDNWGAIVHLKQYKTYVHLMPEKSSSSFTSSNYEERMYQNDKVDFSHLRL